MPLIKSGSREASNISEMMKNHPGAQAIAAALATARKYGKAGGGAMRRAAGYMQGPPPEGMKRGGVVLDRALREARKFAKGGKLDESGLGDPAKHIPHPSGMPNSSIPGRTDKLPISVKAGSYVIPSDIVSAIGDGNSAAGNAAMNYLIGHVTQNAQLGNAPQLAADGAEIPIIAAGGEYVVDPAAVAHIGGGNLEKGHNLLDKFVREIRKLHIKTLRNLPGPKVD